MATMDQYIQATIKELEKIKQAIIENKGKNNEPIRDEGQIKFFRNVINHMVSHLEKGRGVYTILNEDGEETLYSYLDVINHMQNVNNLRELMGNMDMEKIPDHIKISIFDCIFPYVHFLDDCIIPSFFDMKLRIEKEEVEEIEFQRGEE